MLPPLAWLLLLGVLDSLFWAAAGANRWDRGLALMAFELTLVHSLIRSGTPPASVNVGWNMASIVCTFAVLDPEAFSHPRKAASIAFALLALALSDC